MDRASPNTATVIALSGGIGGAKLVLGLNRILAPGCLTVVANTGDDFEHLGLAISPDLDTLMYTLAGVADPIKGWGRSSETWTFMKALEALGGPTWFQLGDSDLATHVERTRRLARGHNLSTITADFCRHLDIATRLLPMSDNPVRTRLLTAMGWMDFQDYFVRMRAEPAVMDIEFSGAATARAQPSALAALSDPMLRAAIICPSNPLISIDPILAVPGMRDALARCHAPVIAISPIIAGNAVKGPTTKMMSELGVVPDALAVARRYADVIDGCIVDNADAELASHSSFPVKVAPTLMMTMQDREALARCVIEFADQLALTKSRQAVTL